MACVGSASWSSKLVQQVLWSAHGVVRLSTQSTCACGKPGYHKYWVVLSM